ncbi:S41 family peptidase [Thalassotalea sp. G2M2-11]|uniref:S41 family peptidase n=1 Tax=Thalassotalea sp. G2M2-11 TaxID=2787627 RepID=UPI0019D2D381|nr:S41 family peptidase [Thalassotalea sp. G2M2-11]
MKKTILIFLLSLIFTSNTLLANESLNNLEKILSPEQMKADLKSWRAWLNNTHPDLSIRIDDVAHFDAAINKIEDEITQPKSVRGFLTKISSLNSQFNDGHMNIFVQSQTKLINAIINKGKGLFPFEVIVNNGKVYILSELGGATSQLSMAEIISINDTPISDIYDLMITRTYGDSSSHRESLLSEKISLYYWLFVNQPEQFSIAYKTTGAEIEKSVFNAALIQPNALANETFEDLFKFELLDKKQALLTINLFWWQDKERFYKFTKNAFQQIKDNNIEHVIIDVRNNPGGDDDMWKQGLLTYIADKPYRHTSKYTKKIIAKYMDEGETEGDVVTADYDKFEKPSNEEPLKFNGKVSVVVGKVTYSSAILFANTMQDFGFAKIVGEKSAGFSWQTGGIQFFSFPYSGLKAVSPRFYLVRPSGEGKGLPVLPDSVLKDNQLNQRTLINEIAKNYLDEQLVN